MRKKKLQNSESVEFQTLPSPGRGRTDADMPAYSEKEMYSSLEEKMKSLHTRKAKRTKLFQIALLVFCCIMSVLLLRGLSSGGEDAVSFRQLVQGIRPGYALAALAVVLVFILVDSFFFAYLCKIMTGRFRPLVSLKVMLLGRYYDNITPLGTGGQPFQMVYLSKRDIPVGAATSMPLIKYFTWVFVNIPLCILLLVLNSKSLAGLGVAEATTIQVAAWVGIALNAIVPIVILLFTVVPKLGEKLVGGIIRLGAKIRIGKLCLVRDPEKAYSRATKTVADFKSSMAYVSKRFWYVLVCVVIMILSIALFYTIPYFVLLAVSEDIEPSWRLFYDIVTMNVFTSLATSFVPTPGASGASEGFFYMVFQGVRNLTRGLLFWVVLIWRVLTYYVFLLIGLVMVAYDFVTSSIKEKVINRKKLSKAREKLLPLLQSPMKEERLASVRMLRSVEKQDRTFAPAPRPYDQKLMLRTDYSNGDYTPSELAYTCYRAGAKIVGIADRETLAGAREFAVAGQALGLNVLVGVDVSCYLSRVRKRNLRINGLYQDDVIHLILTGIPERKWDAVDVWLARFRERRNVRNRKMVDALNEWVKKAGVTVEYKDVLAKSRIADGGTVTESHILEALADALVNRYGRGSALITALQRKLGVTVPERYRKLLLDVVGNPFYLRDVAAVLRDEYSQFYVEADDELCSILELNRVAEICGGVMIYPYMGDLEQRVFGELRVRKYEDHFLFELLSQLSRFGVKGVTYCPSRHTPEQIRNVREIAGKLGLLLFSGETVYDRRLQFEREPLDPERDRDAIRNAAALVGSQREAENGPDGAIFSLAAADKFPDLEQRLDYYASLGEV